jgi:hypothetical protein
MRNGKWSVTAPAAGIVLLVSTVCAQGQNPPSSTRSNTTVTAAATSDRVRFTAPTTVVQMRLEVYAPNGEKVFDNEIRGGNVIDWLLQDGQAQRLSDGSYLCVITSKSLSGRMSQKLGRLTIENTAASLRPIDTTQLTAQQTQAVGPLEENASLTVLKEGETQTATVIAHNGEDGQITRGRGALSFRIGDFYRGKDTEQMRLTPEGNLGIGITHPQARLDVDGLIRTSQGIMFPDGTMQTTAALAGSAGQRPDQEPAGGELFKSINQNTSSGKAGKKGKGVSPELFVNEDLTVNGNIIFTPPLPQAFQRDISMQDNNGGLRFFGAPALTTSPAAAAIQFWGTNSPFHGQLYLDSGAHDSSAVIIRTTGTGGTITERMRVTATGNVGIGTPTPEHRMSIAGGPGWTVDNWGGAVALQNASAIGWQTNASGNRYGIGHTTAGLAFFRTAGNLGTTGSPATYDLRIDNNGNVGIGSIGINTSFVSKLEIFAQDGMRISGFQPFVTLNDTNSGKQSFMQGVNGDAVLLTNSRAALTLRDVSGNVDIQGNVTQNRDKFGSVKAMVYVNEGVIFRCYNGLTGASLQNGTSPDGCGFHVDHPDLGLYFVDFGFQITDRFYSISQKSNDLVAPEFHIINLGSNFHEISPNTLRISVFYNDDRETKTNGLFMVIVY